MKLAFHKWLVFFAFGLLLAHNFIPHHHHHDDLSLINQVHRHYDGGHEHGHSPLSFLHIDEDFLLKSVSLKAVQMPVAVLSFHLILEDIFETKTSGIISNASGRLPLPPFLAAFSFRGPPAV